MICLLRKVFSSGIMDRLWNVSFYFSKSFECHHWPNTSWHWVNFGGYTVAIFKLRGLHTSILIKTISFKLPVKWIPLIHCRLAMKVFFFFCNSLIDTALKWHKNPYFIWHLRLDVFSVLSETRVDVYWCIWTRNWNWHFMSEADRDRGLWLLKAASLTT